MLPSAMAAAPVLFVSYSGILGGAERILLDCATRLRRPAVVACPEGRLAAEARAGGLRVRVLRSRSIRLRGGPRAAARHVAGLAGLAAEVTLAMRRDRPSVVVAWGMRAVLASALRAPGSPPVLAIHNDLVPAGAVGRAVSAATTRAAAVVALSDAIAARLPGIATILRPGVDLDAWVPAPWPGAPPRAVVLGALVAWKAPHVALDVAARMPDLRVDFAGAPMPGDDSGYVEDLRRRAARPDLSGRIRFLGSVDDPRPLLRDAHVLLHCGIEPYGLALVEALAAGRPVVAPAVAGPLEILRPAADASHPPGRLYPLGDAGAAAAAIRATLGDPGAPPAARAHAEAHFDVRAGAARFAAVVEALA